MSIGLVLNFKGEDLRPLAASVEGLIDCATIVNTSNANISNVNTAARDAFAYTDVVVHHRPWVDYGTNRTWVMTQAKGRADWTLWADADVEIDAHPDLKDWLANDPDPTVDAWMVEIINHDLRYRQPLLMRGNQEWVYRGVIHEYLDVTGCTTRPLIGLTVTHLGTGRGDRLEDDLALLEPGFEAGSPRDTFYYAECLRFLGRTDEAIAAYRKRDELGDWDEEAWYAAYQAARLAADVPGLFEVWLRRPWRHEPLKAAAAIVADTPHSDVLFVEAA